MSWPSPLKAYLMSTDKMKSGPEKKRDSGQSLNWLTVQPGYSPNFPTLNPLHIIWCLLGRAAQDCNTSRRSCVDDRAQPMRWPLQGTPSNLLNRWTSVSLSVTGGGGQNFISDVQRPLKNVQKKVKIKLNMISKINDRFQALEYVLFSVCFIWPVS